MNILMIAHRLPYPPNKGEKIRSYHELAHLARRHDVWCACLIESPADLQHVDPMRRLCRDLAAVPVGRIGAALRAATALLTGKSLSEAYFAEPQLKAALQRWNRQVRFDAVLGFSSNVAGMGLLVDAPRRVADVCDADSVKWTALSGKVRWPRSAVYALEGRRLARTEWQLAHDYDAVTVISQREVAALERNWSGRGWPVDDIADRLVVIPNGVDVPPDPPPDAPPEAKTVGFTGTMSYLPNIEAVCWFAKEVWPLVRDEHPEAEFLIVGRDPSPTVKALHGRDGIRVTGEVPDVTAYLRRFTVAVAPMRTVHGVQNKTLEALAAGVPVVATPAVAESIDAEPGRHLLAAAEALQLGRAICELINNKGRWRDVALAGREFVIERYGWAQHLSNLEALLAGPEEVTVHNVNTGIRSTKSK